MNLFPRGNPAHDLIWILGNSIGAVAKGGGFFGLVLHGFMQHRITKVMSVEELVE